MIAVLRYSFRQWNQVRLMRLKTNIGSQFDWIELFLYIDSFYSWSLLWY